MSEFIGFIIWGALAIAFWEFLLKKAIWKLWGWWNK